MKDSWTLNFTKDIKKFMCLIFVFKSKKSLFKYLVKIKKQAKVTISFIHWLSFPHAYKLPFSLKKRHMNLHDSFRYYNIKTQRITNIKLKTKLVIKTNK